MGVRNTRGRCILCDETGHYRTTCPNPKRTLAEALLWREKEDEMASRRRANDDGTVSAKGEVSPPVSINEVELQVDADNDEGDADHDKVIAAGAVSAESVAFNEQTKNVITGKRDRSRRIRWNDDNAQVVYDAIRQAGWNTASTYVACRRVTGEPAQWSVSCSAIPNGDALYKWVQTTCHKTSPAHTYEIRVMDSHTNQDRGRGKLFMPDTMGDEALQERHQLPNPYAQPPNPYTQYLQPGMPPPGWFPGMPSPQQPPAAAAPVAPQAPPPPPAAQASGEVADLRAQVGYLSGQLAQLLTKVGMPAPVAPAPPPAPSITDVLRAMPPLQVAPAAPAPTAQPAPQPQGAPPGLIHVPGFGYINAELVASALMTQMRSTLAPPQQPPAPPAPRPVPIAMQHAPGHHDPNGPPHGGHLGAVPIPRPEPPQSIGEMMQSHARNMKETAGGLAAMVAAADNMREVFAPEKDDDDKPAAPKQQDGSPAKKPFEVLDAGPVRVPYDPETGNMKGIANLLMVNADKIGGFVGKLYERAATVAAQAQAQQNAKPFTPPPSLPNGTATPNWPPSPSMPRP